MIRVMIGIALLTIVVTVSALSIAFAQEPLPTRWKAPPGVERLPHEVWESTGPFKVTEVSAVGSDTKTDEERIAIIVDSSVYIDIYVSLATYQADLATKGYSSVVSMVTGGTPEDVRDYLISLYTEPDSLIGTVLVGSVPYIIYEMEQDWGDGPEYEDFPCDLFFMDMDGTWVDDGAGGTVGAGNGKYDGWNDANKDLEIWAGRLYVEILPQYGTPSAVLNTYFTKNHLYRTGQLVPENPPARGLIYVDDDWGSMVEGYHGDRDCAERVYDDVLAVYDDYGHGNNTTALDYINNHMTADYQLIMLRSHGWPGGHGFYQDSMTVFDYVYNSDYRDFPPDGLFYSLFVCSGCDYTAQYGTYDSYLGGTIAFNQPYGLVAWGSAKTGGMWNDWPFYNQLGNGELLGKAFIKWFNNSHALYPSYAPPWWYGMVMTGDPALKPNADYFPPAIPEDLVAGPGTSSIDLTWSPNTEPDLGSYNIYRDVDGMVPEYLASVTAPSTSYQDFAVGNDTTYVYWVTSVDTLNNESDYSVPDSCTYSDVGAVAGGHLEPRKRFVKNNPNPFSQSTVISFSLAQEGRARLSIYDVSGRRVCTLVDGSVGRGVHRAVWDGRDDRGQRTGMGIYLCCLEDADGSRLTRKIMLLE
ncbi:MAG: T9SS type A sorting domain-containing protein [Candidatus Eisenbacteria bacterium]